MNRTAAVFLSCCMVAPSALGQVSVRQEKMTIPTWEIGPPAVHSLFHSSRDAIYPYTLNEVLTDRKVDKVYDAVILENEYVKVLILPEIGGRVHGAVDKTNNYVWLYWQPTIKPGLISMTGAWISGGIEWNFPHGHRPSGYMPVDHRIVRNNDGSATVWVGETEPIYRMRWLVGLTVFPGRSLLRCDYIFVNPTNHKHPFQFWATAATHANEWAQAQYPGDMVTGHGKHEFWNWPIHKGVDLTWWKNSPNASSYFAFNNPSDWFGAYDHRAGGGMVHVADHRVMPGKKLWTWGSGPSGRIWEDILSEGGGAYFEPQAGAWSDNQPDYHWMWPNEVKTAHDYWYPVRNTRGYHNADRDFALNTDLKDGVAFGAVYSTGVAKDHRVVLTDAVRKTTLVDKTITISPDQPFTAETKVGNDVSVYDLHLAVYDAAGRLCLELQQQRPKEVKLPPGLKDPGDPRRLNQDQLFHSGEWLDKFVRREEGLEYYRQALKKDPDDSRVNTELGFLLLKQGDWNGALRRLDQALKRDYDNSRIYFGKGLACVGRGDYEEAYDHFHRASYTYDYFASSYLNLARLDLRRGDFRGALARLSEAEAQNGKLADIPALKAVAHRHLDQHGEALSAADKALQLDPMHFMGGYEKSLALRSLNLDPRAWETTWNGIMRNAAQNLLELAAGYAEAGLYQDAEAPLATLCRDQDAAHTYPMVNYLRAHFRLVQGDAAGAADLLAKAAAGPVVYVNPHRIEEKSALESALSRNPNDAHAHLFLGNLLYAWGLRPEGLEHWRAAVRLDPALALAWRNVAYAEQHFEKKPQTAYASYRRAFELDPTDARVLLEMIQLAERLRMPAAARLALLEAHPETVSSRDDLSAALVDLRIAQGSPDSLGKAHEVLSARHFHTWEGRYGIHLSWVEVNQKLGDLAFGRKDFTTALDYYRQALEYPKNLEVAPRTPDFRAHLNWDLAKAYLALGRREEAKRGLEEILAEKYEKPHLGTFYQALAQKELNRRAEYDTLLAKLEKRSRDLSSGKFEYRGDLDAIGRYLLSLVLGERGDQAAAELERKAALARAPQVRRLAIRQAQLDVAAAHQ